MTLGIIIGNRDFFPDSLVEKARIEILDVFSKLNLKPILLDTTDSKLGGVEVYKDAQKCADLFKKHREEIAGVLVLLPNFGDEKGVADTLKLAGLNVPVLVQAYPDELSKMKAAKQRKDAAEMFQGQNRTDLYEKEMAELAVIEEFLPKQLSIEEVKEKVAAIIASTGATSITDLGKVMGVASKELAGLADGKAISGVVRELLA